MKPYLDTHHLTIIKGLFDCFCVSTITFFVSEYPCQWSDRVCSFCCWIGFLPARFSSKVIPLRALAPVFQMVLETHLKDFEVQQLSHLLLCMTGSYNLIYLEFNFCFYSVFILRFEFKKSRISKYDQLISRCFFNWHSFRL